MKICIIDDDIDLAESLADLIALHGHDVRVAHSGEEGAKSIRQSPVDLALIDVRLPGIDGIECVRWIRREASHAKVVLMTGYSVADYQKEASDAGALAVWSKPLDIEKVLSLLEDSEPHLAPA